MEINLKINFKMKFWSPLFLFQQLAEIISDCALAMSLVGEIAPGMVQQRSLLLTVHFIKPWLEETYLLKTS